MKDLIDFSRENTMGPICKYPFSLNVSHELTCGREVAACNVSRFSTHMVKHSESEPCSDFFYVAKQ